MAELISNQKNFKQCTKLLIGGIEKLVEWSDQTRRPLLIIYEDEGGLSHTGTKNMRQRAMLNGTTGWEMCARLDTILLNSEDPEESSNARAIRPENKSLAKICNMQALPLLPLPLEQKSVGFPLVIHSLSFVSVGHPSAIRWGFSVCRFFALPL